MSKDLLLKTRSSKASKSSDADKPQQHDRHAQHAAEPKAHVSKEEPKSQPHKPLDHSKPAAKTSKELGASFPKRSALGGSFGNLSKSISGFSKFEKFAEASKDSNDKTKLIPSAPTKQAGPKPMRFSERYKLQGDGDNSLIKIVTFILVVIAMGLGVIYFVQNNLLSSPSDSGSNTTSSSSSAQLTARSEDGLLIFNQLIADAEATGVVENEDFTQQQTTLGTRDNNVARLTKLTYEPFASFTRLTWDLEGVEASFPRIEVKQDGDNVLVTFFRVGVEYDAMLETIPLQVGNFLSISSTNTDAQTQFTLLGQEVNSFYARLPFDDGKIVIDFKTEAQLAVVPSSSASSSSQSSVSSTSSAASTSSASSSASSSAVSTTSADTGDNVLKTGPSQDAQSIVNTTTGIDAKMQNYSYQDFGPKFEFRWEFAGTSLKSLPNTDARIISDNGRFYVEVVMKNVTQDLFYAYGWDRASFGSLSLNYSNLKAVIFKGRTGTTSTYWVELGGRSNYELIGSESSSAGRRRLTIAVYD